MALQKLPYCKSITKKLFMITSEKNSMKNQIRKIQFMIMVALLPLFASAQFDNNNLVLVQKWKMKKPENGSRQERDSLLEIYNKNVIFKNPKIIMHKEFAHFITGDSKDYIIIEEFKDYAEMDAANKLMDELEKQAWPDKKKRDEFFALIDKYFENWHGDELYSINPKLSK